MKTILILLVGIGTLVAAGQVAPPNGNDVPVNPELRYIDFNDPEWWEYMARTEANVPRLTLGRTEYEARGPIVENIKPRPIAPDATLLDRMTRIPLFGLFVPQKMPTPPQDRGRFFAWGERDVPWSSLSDPNGAPIRNRTITATDMVNF